MAVATDRILVAGPRPREVWLTLTLSVLFHALISAGVILVPHFQVGSYVRVPVSYTVSLVDAPPGERVTGRPPATAAPAPAPAPAPPAPAVRSAPAPAPVPPPAVAPKPEPKLAPTEELTLPGRRTTRMAPPEREPSLRPPSASEREPPHTAPSPPAPITPIVPAVPAPAPTPAQAPPVASRGAGTGPGAGAAVASTGAVKESGVEVAGATPGAGSRAGGDSALASYLTLLDWKIQQNWVPVGAVGAPEMVVIVRFRVLRSGQVRDVELEAGSGNPSLDASALRAIRQSLPLPPFPILLMEPSLDLRYRFVMERG